ncbi:MAG: 50S ribosomal protein L4 [Planctomycetota bacterium]
MAWLSTRNIPYVKILASSDLNTYEVLKQKKILLTRDALDSIG